MKEAEEVSLPATNCRRAVHLRREHLNDCLSLCRLLMRRLKMMHSRQQYNVCSTSKQNRSTLLGLLPRGFRREAAIPCLS